MGTQQSPSTASTRVALDTHVQRHARYPAAVRAPMSRIDRWLAARVQRTIQRAGVRLELWDGTSPYPASAPSIGDLVVDDRRTLFGLAFSPDVSFGEAYMAGRLHVRGRMREVFAALSRASLADPTW